MNWTNPPGTESQPGDDTRRGPETPLSFPSPAPQPPGRPGASPGSPGPGKAPVLQVSKGLTLSGTGQLSGLEVFSLTLGDETIELLPFKNWIQLDHHKWTARGRLPGEPAGLEIAPDHVKLSGETVLLGDLAGCEKLERLFNDWLSLEKETLELARKKAHAPVLVPGAEPAARPESRAPRFGVEVDKRGQVHIHCMQGREAVASIGLTLAGFSSLFQQELMRKPQKLATGALHDWVELDGELCSFEKGRNDAARLEQLLNERYLPQAAAGHGKEVIVYLNAASSTGFDIQFPVTLAGVPENHRDHLNEQSLELLQDPDRCGLLQQGLIVKLIPPNLIFKHKTPEGGEQYLARRPEHILNLTDEEGRQKAIDLSQPLNFLHLAPAELKAVFNHPAINRHAAAAPAAGAPRPQPFPAAPSQAQAQPAPSTAPAPVPQPQAAQTPSAPTPAAMPGPGPAEAARPLPNLWLKEILAAPALDYDWFAYLAYARLAEWFGNSEQGQFGPSACWYIALAESQGLEDPAFKGLFLTEKGSLGFLSAGQVARFYNGVAFLGPRQAALEGLRVRLVAVGLDGQQRVVFVVSDNYRAQFDVPDTALADVLQRLAGEGAVILGVTEALARRDPLEVVWTVPAEQLEPSDPQALESLRPPSD